MISLFLWGLGGLQDFLVIGVDVCIQDFQLEIKYLHRSAFNSIFFLKKYMFLFASVDVAGGIFYFLQCDITLYFLYLPARF